MDIYVRFEVVNILCTMETALRSIENLLTARNGTVHKDLVKTPMKSEFSDWQLETAEKSCNGTQFTSILSMHRYHKV